MKERLIIAGSPRKEGRSAYLLELIIEQHIRSFPQMPIRIFSLSERTVEACTGCDACKRRYQCIIQDDAQELSEMLDAASWLTLVSPVYFAGAPAQLKAVLDRMQPYYWQSFQSKPAIKRKADLYVVGEGGDPHGFEPLVVSARSALAVAGFALQKVYSGVGLDNEGLRDLAVAPDRYLYEGPQQGDLYD